MVVLWFVEFWNIMDDIILIDSRWQKMDNYKQKITQKGWFRNIILIAIPTVISAMGVVISLFVVPDSIKNVLVLLIVILTLVLIGFVLFFSKQDDNFYEEYEKLSEENKSLTTILAHMENLVKTNKFTITTFSEMSEKWSKNINAFSNNILVNNRVSNKSWDKVKYYDMVCLQCKKMIMQYCNNVDATKVSVGFVSYREDANGEKYIHMISHSSPEATRPNACKKEEKLMESQYYYADLIKDEYSDVDVATNNEEIRRRFRKISKNTILSKYTQYIAIPVYCTSDKLLGIFQVVTKYDYIIESDKVELLKFAEESVVPYSNLIVLIDKINKGLYINPGKIDVEE